METATSLAIGRLTGYMRELTQRLDARTGWYGEFLRRDPDGVRACLDGAAIPPWDVVESLLRDLAGVLGPEVAQREAAYAGGLRAAAVAAWDRMPGGAEELRALLAASDDQRGHAQAALRELAARLGGATDPAEADALARELSWTRDDAARASSRHEDLVARLGALPAGPPPHASAAVAEPVGRAEGRWLRGAPRRSGGARYAGPAEPRTAFTAPPGHPDAPAPAAAPAPERGLPAPRGARFGRPGPAPDAAGGADGPSADGPGRPAGPAAATRVRTLGAFVGELLALRGEGRTGEAHALLCEAAAWPAERLPVLAAELGRAGLAADWETLLWEAASLPPERLAAAAGALGEAGRAADCDRLLRQGVARPTGEIADAALALGAAGRTREAGALLDAFVRVRTAEESAALARRAPQWFAPQLLRAAAALSATHRRDLAHALRVAGISTVQTA
ncbi:hypothetical protein AB0P12_01560 [Streptomyces subrutilus]|uniref:hypothetical protein n=1 Tax=Streptomyces subrutilus TaxID=36818 RepID=UPI00341F84FB